MGIINPYFPIEISLELADIANAQVFIERWILFLGCYSRSKRSMSFITRTGDYFTKR